MTVSYSDVYESVLHSTLTKSRGKLILAQAKSNALVGWMLANKRVDFEDGGYEITNPLTIGRNPNISTYRYYGPLPLEQTQEFTTLKYYTARMAGSVIISEQEMDENRGRAQIFKLVNAKMDVLQVSIQEKFSEYGYGAGLGTDPNGLTNLIPLDPTTGSIGGLNRATQPQVRTSSYLFNGSIDETNIEEAFDDVELDMTVKGQKPDVILCGRNIWRMYKAAVRDKFTIPLSGGSAAQKKMYDLGFTGVSHNNTTMLFDEDCPADRAYWINSTYQRYHIFRHVNMKTSKLTAPWTIDAVGRRVKWQGQWCQWKMYRTHAVMSNEVTV